MNGKWDRIYVENDFALGALLDRLTTEDIPVMGICPAHGESMVYDNAAYRSTSHAVLTGGYHVYFRLCQK